MTYGQLQSVGLIFNLVRSHKIISNQVSNSIGIMLRVKKNVDVNVLKMLYHSLIQPYFQYCNIILATHRTQRIELLFRKHVALLRC